MGDLLMLRNNTVTGPAKKVFVGKNYTLSHNKSFLSTGTEYLYSVPCMIKPIKHIQPGAYELPKTVK